MTNHATITIDEAEATVTVRDDTGERRLAMESAEAFAAISRAWLRCGWDTKYVYGFSWLGRPIIQLPEDMIRIQEVIYRIRPDVVIETGVAHGGSLIFHASLCRAIGKGRVIGIDIEIRPHNRAAIEAHEMFDGIMGEIPGAPRTDADWDWNNPAEAARDFAAAHPDFVIEEPDFPFNEGMVKDRVTYWPSAYLKRVG